MYLTDPITKEKSVTLTFAVVSFLFVLGFAVANALEYSKEPGALMDLFYACAALYFGRRVNLNGKIFSGNDKGTNE